MTQGAIANNISNLKDFASYASNGTSWVSVSTLQRTVQFATRAYYADGGFVCDLPTGSYVCLTKNCTRGQSNKNCIAVTAVQPKGKYKITFSGKRESFKFCVNSKTDIRYVDSFKWAELSGSALFVLYKDFWDCQC